MFSHVFLLKYMCVFVRVCVCVCVYGSTDSEGSDGLNVFYVSKFSAPATVALEIQNSKPDRLQRRLPFTNKFLYNKNEERYYLNKEEDTLSLLGQLSTLCPPHMLQSYFIWMVPYRLSTDAQIMNTLYLDGPL